MFESLSDHLNQVFKSLRGEVQLTPETIEVALRKIRMVLLEADVNFKVVKAFTDRVKDRAMNRRVLNSLTPGQQVVKIVRDEMLVLFGGTTEDLTQSRRLPRVVLILGLPGTGKTTTIAKLGHLFSKQGHRPLLVSTDVRRPAALAQLTTLAANSNLQMCGGCGELDAVTRARGALREAKDRGSDILLIDTAGSFHNNDLLMTELRRIKMAVEPLDILYVVDAMAGQDAIKSAGDFHRNVGITGVILTKMDGDARGGAALSVVSVVGVPIIFIGTGERVDDFGPFHPERMLSRILGMGDILSLVEKAEKVVQKEAAERLESKARLEKFTLEDFLEQLVMIRKMRPLHKVIELLPSQGVTSLQKMASGALVSEEFVRVEAILNSMTPKERSNYRILSGSRRRRIAKGSGTSVEDINRLLKQFVQMLKMLKVAGCGVVSGRKRKKLSYQETLFGANFGVR